MKEDIQMELIIRDMQNKTMKYHSAHVPEWL